MSEEVRSMSISLSMEDAGIDRTLAQVRRSFRTLTNDVKLVNKEFQYGEKGISDYENKVTELSSAVKIAKGNVGDLEKQYHTIGKEQGYTSAEALKLRQEWAKQKNELNFLQRDLEGATSDLKAFQKQQMIANSNWTKSGNAFSSMSKSLDSISSKLTSTGKSLTNSITKPALIAGTAIGGITAKLGFDRLVGLDTAQAKLEGLGYSTKEVGEISDQVTNAIKGGMTTMAEGTDVAAGALASGVKEGKELEHYIKLVGDAAVGANRPVSDMAMIFNRVQGQGKLMTEELNMIEEGMPGFSKAMAKHLGVSYEEFRKMVTEGQVTSKDFLTVMDDFAGGMAGAYSKSFKGMVSNTKAYIGMIGESLLSGVFEKSKDSLAEFEKLLQSPSVQKWAQETGDKLGNVVNSISNAISGIISWFNSLDKGTQKSIASIMKWSTLILIGIGPVLTILGKLTGALAGTFGTFGKFLGFMGKLSVESKTAGGLLKGFTNLMPKTGAVITALTGPIGWITLGIVALGTAFVVAYKKSETFRNIVNAALNGVKQTFMNIGNVVKGFFQLFKGNGQDGVITLSKILPPNVVVGLTNFATKVKTIFFQVINAIKTFATSVGSQLNAFWAKNGTEIMTAVRNIGNAISTTFKFIWNNVIKPIMTLIWNLMKALWPAIRMLIISVWNNIKGVIQGALNIILGTIKVFSSLLTGNWKGVWQGIVQIVRGAVKLAWNLVQLWFVGKILKVVKVGLVALRGVVVKGWTFIRNFIGKTAQSIWNSVRTKFTGMFKSVRGIFTNLSKWSSNLWTALKNKITSLGQMIWTNVRNKFNGLYKSTRSIFTSISKFARNLWTNLKNAITKLAQNIWTNVRNKFTGMFKSVRGILGKLFNSSKNIFTNIKNSVTNLAHGARDNVANGFKAMYDKGKSWLNKLKNFIGDSKEAFKKKAASLGKAAANGAISGLNKMIGGINKISKAITDKNLIKKIPKLSTGTSGAIKSPTAAIVNDKGPGNGSGPKGHQELIAKKDGTLHAPVGKNVLVGLEKGDSVINGRHTQQLVRTGVIPQFHSGKNSEKEKDNILSQTKDKAGKFGADVMDTAHSAVDKSKKTVKAGINAAKDGASWLGDKIGDVWDYVKNPGKLVDKVLGGISFGGKKANATMRMAGLAFNKLKKSLVAKVKSWFEEAEGGDGDASWLFKHDIWQKFGSYTGGIGFNGGKHYGMDFGMTPGTPVYAVKGGIAKALSDYGGGKMVQVKTGANEWNWYAHLSKQLVKAGQRVQAGDKIALSGNTGAFTRGSGHLHFQLMRGSHPGNDTAIDPYKWLKNLQGAGGTNKAAAKWAPDIKRAAKRMKVNLSNSELKGIIAQIQRESNGNAGVTQDPRLKDGNSGANLAKGLLQYVPSTFKAYAVKGHNNIKSGYDQLLAFFNNSNWRKDLPYGKSGWGPTGSRRFATGGIIRTNGLYNLAEEGHEEVVIPTDPRRASDAMKLINYAANKVQRGKNDNKRPNQIKSSTNTLSNNNNAELLQALTELVVGQQEQMKKLDKQISILTEIAMKAGFNEGDVSKAQGKRAEMLAWNMGGAIT